MSPRGDNPETRLSSVLDPGFNAPKSESGLTEFHISPRLYFLVRNGVFLAPTDIKLCTLVESDDLHIWIGYDGR